MQAVAVSKHKNYSKRFSICSLVTDLDEYQEMLNSAKKAGFDGDDVEYLFADNTQGNTLDGFSGFNRFDAEATGEYLIMCHQDVLFDFDTRQVLEDRIAELDRLDSDWALAGNAGKSHSGHAIIRISDPLTANIKQGNFPAKVQTLDENILVYDRKKPIVCSNQLSGFHLYGSDLCLNAEALGYSNYVIDFHLLHKSTGNPNEAYFAIQKNLMDLHRQRKQSAVIQAMCSRFYVSSSRLGMALMNRAWLLNLHKSITKKLDKTSQS